jgi:transcriptional regulator with XRE-family HTH domain
VKYQQVQKYEEGANRISASRLQQIAGILKVEPSFFFDGAPGHVPKGGHASAPDYVDEFIASKDGLALAAAFVAIKSDKSRRELVRLVAQIAET